MFGIESEPQVCEVLGSQIKDMIDRHIAEGEAAIETFRTALAEGVGGVDWECAIETLQDRIKTARMARPAIGRGPYAMSVAQWIQLANRWPPVLDAKAVLSEQTRRQAHAATHRKPDETSERAS